MSEIEKIHITDYLFAAISSIAMGIILLIIGAYISNGDVSEGLSFWDLVSGFIGSPLKIAGAISIIFLPPFSCYIIQKTGHSSKNLVIATVASMMVFFIIIAILAIIIGIFFIDFETGIDPLDWTLSLTGTLLIWLFGRGFIILSPVITCYGVYKLHKEWTE